MTVKIELAGNGRRIYVDSYRPISLTGVIPGAHFNKGRGGGGYWSLPLSLAVCQRLREEFGGELEIGPNLWSWAKAEKQKAASMRELATASDAKLTRVRKVAPRLARAMAKRKYQRVGARFIADATANGAGCLVADQPGLGKTLEAIAGVLESGVSGPYLVIAPKTSVDPVWGREIPRWLDGQTVVTLPEGDRGKTKQRQRRNDTLNALISSPSLDATWLIVHPEAIRSRVWWVCGFCGQKTPRKAGKVVLDCQHDAELRLENYTEHEYEQLFQIEWGAIIVDESDRALMRLRATPTQTRQGAELLRLRPGGVRVAMTGTPTRGRPHLMWGQLNWLDPKAFPSFWNWAQMFWEVKSNGFSDYVIGQLVREEELWRSMDRYVIRRTKAEVARDLPAKTYVGSGLDPGDPKSPFGVWLPMEPEQSRIYKEMLERSVAELPDGNRLEAVGILAELTRLKQFAGAAGRLTADGKFKPSLPSNKFEYVVQLLDELGYPDSPTTKVVIVSQFTEMLELFARELPARLKSLSVNSKSPIKPEMEPLLLTGAQSKRARESAIAKMNEPLGSGGHILLLQTKTGGVAITLDRADVMIFLDETWVPDDQEQAEDRIHRVSNPRPVFYHYLRSLESIDHGIALVNAERADANKRLLDTRRGVEYARAVFRRTREL